MKWGCGPRQSRLHPSTFKDPPQGLPAVVRAVEGPSSAPVTLPPLRAGGLKRLKWQEWGGLPTALGASATCLGAWEGVPGGVPQVPAPPGLWELQKGAGPVQGRLGGRSR